MTKDEMNKNKQVENNKSDNIETLDSSDFDVIQPAAPSDTTKFSEEKSNEESPKSEVINLDQGIYDETTKETIYVDDDVPKDEQADDFSSNGYSQTYASGNEDSDYYNENSPYVKTVNKHLFVWVFSFLLCMLGVDRFVRGQFFLGLFKFITGGLGGIWYIVDFLIAFYKAYIGPFAGEKNFQFVLGHWTK